MARPEHLSDIYFAPTNLEQLMPLIDVLSQEGVGESFTGKILDLGSGDGTVLDWFMTQFPDTSELVGWELDETRATDSQVAFPSITIVEGDMWDVTSLNTYDIIYLYWMPHIMEGFVSTLWPSVKTGALVISNWFELPGLTPIAEAGFIKIYRKV